MPGPSNHRANDIALHPHPTLVTAYEYEWGNSVRIFPALIEYNMAYLVASVESQTVPVDSARTLLQVLLELRDEGFNALDYRAERDGLQPNLEAEVRRRTGADISGWLSIGRARQECELVARQMVERDGLIDVLKLVQGLIDEFAVLACRDADAVMPYHTWAQHAEPVTFGYYLSATANALVDDHARLEHAFMQINRSRAGIGQIVPPPLPVDRARLASLLGFDGTLSNSMHGYSSLDLELATLSALTIFSANLARLAETFFVWASPEFGFLKFGTEFTGTSYAMPHKQNPYALRLVRPIASRVAGAFAETLQLFSGSLQIVGNGVIHIPNRTIDALDAVADVCRMLESAIPTLVINRTRMRAVVLNGMANAPQLLFHLVSNYGVSYRQAHEICADLVNRALNEPCALTDLPANHIAEAIEQVTGTHHDVDPEAVRSALEPEAIVASRVNGGPAPNSVIDQVTGTKTLLDAMIDRINRIVTRRQDAAELLAQRITAIATQS
jgi:argininosuccinate lyase